MGHMERTRHLHDPVASASRSKAGGPGHGGFEADIHPCTNLSDWLIEFLILKYNRSHENSNIRS